MKDRKNWPSLFSYSRHSRQPNKSRALKFESLEGRELLSVSPKMVINNDADITNTRAVIASFTNLSANPQSVRFGFNSWNLGSSQPYSANMSVTLPNYLGTNWLNSEVLFADGHKEYFYDSIRYVTPSAQINSGVDRTNLRDVTVSFQNVAPDAVGVRFAYNGPNYGTQVPFNSSMTVTLPNYEGQNFVNAQLVYANQQTRTIWDSIEYKRASVTIDSGAATTNDRQVRLSFKDVSSDAQSVSFAYNGFTYGAPVTFTPQMDVILPDWDGSNFVNAKVRYATGREAWLWDSIDYTPDTDSDGLYDRWERGGIDVNADGTIDLQLPGADPEQKDLYVEIDSMVGRAPLTLATPVPGLETGFSTGTVLDRVTAVFQQHGIRLHLQIDERDIPVSDFPNGFDEFDAIKANRWGTPAERSSTNSAATLQAKRLAYRYAMFANTHSNGGSSGSGELLGNDFMITLGSSGGTADQQAATFMHELGHNLGLRHGGADDVNYKPNYHSVMNYLWQFPGQNNDEQDWSLDYSTEQLPTLNEEDLSELAGIGFDEDSGHGDHAVRLCDIRLFGSCLLSVPEHGPVDFNWDGDATDDHVTRDLNGDGTLSELHGHNDWANLQLAISNSENFDDGVHTSISNEFFPIPISHQDPADPSGARDYDSKFAAAWIPTSVFVETGERFKTARGEVSQDSARPRPRTFNGVMPRELTIARSGPFELKRKVSSQLGTDRQLTIATDDLFAELACEQNC
jgi:hypothetical protein